MAQTMQYNSVGFEERFQGKLGISLRAFLCLSHPKRHLFLSLSSMQKVVLAIYWVEWCAYVVCPGGKRDKEASRLPLLHCQSVTWQKALAGLWGPHSPFWLCLTVTGFRTSFSGSLHALLYLLHFQDFFCNTAEPESFRFCLKINLLSSNLLTMGIEVIACQTCSLTRLN